jgi:hypothetical protein
MMDDIKKTARKGQPMFIVFRKKEVRIFGSCKRMCSILAAKYDYFPQYFWVARTVAKHREDSDEFEFQSPDGLFRFVVQCVE